MRRPFNAIQSLILRKMAEALFDGRPMAITPAQVVENLQDLFGNVHGDKPKTIGVSIYAVAVALGGPLFVFGTVGFRRRRIEKRLQRTRFDLFQDLARLRGIIYAGYYGHWLGNDQDDNLANPVLNGLGFILPKHRNPRGAGELDIPEPGGNDLKPEAFVGHDAVPLEADVIVIGSGAGGATAAAELTRYGHDVLIVEAGPHYPSTRITHEEKRMAARLFVDGGVQTSKDNDIILFQGRCVGGSTVINNGICLRVKEPGQVHAAADDVVAKWASLGAPIAASDLDAAYAAVETAIGVNPIAPRSGRLNGPHLLDGWGKYATATQDPRDLAAPARWFEKNWGKFGGPSECVYCGYCNTGCPYGRKNGAAQGRLIEAVGRGARILCDATAVEVHWSDEDADGKRVANAVEVLLEDGRRKVIKALKGVVVAGGAMASSRLLVASGVENSGEGISLNIASPVVALMPGPERRAWDEDQMSTYVDRGDFLLESHFQPPMSMATLVPGWFEEHFDRMKNYNRLASAGVLFPADRCGRMSGGKLDFKLSHDVELPLVKRAIATLAKVHFAAGASEVYPAVTRGGTLTRAMYDTPGAIEAFIEDAVDETDDLVLSSSHPQGGNAIGSDPSTSVVGMDFKVHGTANLMVADASLFPSCIRVNAQLTTMAMAHLATARGDPF